jgi:hypothetical protein
MVEKSLARRNAEPVADYCSKAASKGSTLKII